MASNEIKIFDPENAGDLGFRHPAIFLSASVPYKREKGTAAQKRRNHLYLPALHTEVRSAIVQLARFAFARDIQLVFGGHPAISPLVLQATQSVPKTEKLRVAIFQSSMYRHVIPPATITLANEHSGKIFWTRSDGPPLKDAPRDEQRIETSLEIMREQMVAVPGLIAGVFVGGMDGVEAESALFQKKNGRCPRYALAGTGGAARILFNRDRARFSGKLSLADIQSTNYARVARRIFEDLGYD